MAFKIIWSPEAIEDLRSLTTFVAMDNPEAAERMGWAIIDKAEYLVEHPRLGRMVPERKDPRIREVIQRPYRIIYRLNDWQKSIDILRVWHAARGEPEIQD